MPFQNAVSNTDPHQSPSAWLHRLWMVLVTAFLAASLAACGSVTVAPKASFAPNATCIIASNDGQNRFRTDRISNCRIDTTNGDARFTLSGQSRSRVYDSVGPITPQYRSVATYWLSRLDQLPVPAQTNPAGFDMRAFLQTASEAQSGLVLIRSKGRGQSAMNIAFVTNGVYRSIDFSGTDFKEIPTGFLTTAR